MVDDDASDPPTPIFLSNSYLASFFEQVPQSVRQRCLLMFGSEHDAIFGKGSPDYDDFIRKKQAAGQFHTLKSADWKPGRPCYFEPASEFLESNGFNPLHLDMEYYHENLDPCKLVPEVRRQAGRSNFLQRIEENFEDARTGTGCFGHDYGPVLAMVSMADQRLFPILSDDGLRDYMSIVKPQ